ncbi:rho GTPase-activating protein 44 isoform X2 [Patella vulgata]|uniref:rho GTPase-activating protein 44 isoform X2 n=1 Tax=Patella vulgata TaxID=6465 RepID=UPI0024A83EB7|nr:rho GTPase-activating protein 44 isoform X2 [Patella vulgata]XP_050390051.2 rho GTPase-activating protein 44 isoform X2 [Patella vulgata]
MWKKENLRKNFLRVKQLADQNLGRSEKSEVLSEDLLAIEKRVETVKQVCSNINKKLGSSLQAQGENIEKRLKKLPETSLAHTLIESSTLLGTGTESVLGLICQLCGEAQNILAREQLQYEINVEKEVLGPLQAIFDNDIPAIMKARKHLTKTTLDMDSAKGRLTTAVRQSHVPGTNIASAAAKADVIKEEYEEASAKVEHVKDSLAVEMSNFIAKETEHSQKLLALVEAQAAYHKKALEAIQVVIPRMQHAIENNPTKPVFGHPLEEHLRVTGRDIAVVLEACVMTLLLTGMDEEGLFRIGGASSKLKKLKACFDANIVDMEEFRHDPHTVAGALKQYLRELPEPLLTYQLYSDFMEAASLPKDKLHPALKKVVDTLPRINYNNFRYLIKFLDKLAKNSDKNKMSAGNIAIVIAPNLLWSPGENAPNMLTTGSLSTIIDAILSNADFFFPGDLEFAKTLRGTAPAMSTENVNISTQDKTDSQSTPPSDISRQSSIRNSRLDFYNNQVPSQNSRTSSQSSFLEGRHNSGSASESSDIFLDTNILCDNISLDESLSAAEGESSSPRSRNLSSAQTNHSANQSPIRYNNINHSRTGSSSPRSRSVPPAQVAKSFHSDVYSTVTALQSLGSSSGSWSDYFSKVQAVRDETFHHTPSTQSTGASNQGKGDTTPPIPPSDTSVQNSGETTEESKGAPSNLTSKKEFDFSNVGEHTPPSMSPSQTRADQRPLEINSTLAIQSNNLSVSPSINRPVSPVSPGIDVSYGQDNQSPEQYGTQKRTAKKPAPPPPPDRPYTVAVTASVTKQNTNPYQTWPRHQGAPLASPEIGSSTVDIEEETIPTKPAIVDRPHPPDRPTGPPPDRPKAPPPLAPHPQGHNRSASTGAMFINQQAPLQESPNGQDKEGSKSDGVRQEAM